MDTRLRRHFMRWGGFYMLGALLSISCATQPEYTPYELPRPTEPEVTRFIKVDSIPNGADIYEFDSDGNTLGEKIGTTPMTIPVGFAKRMWSNGSVHSARMWGHGVEWEEGGSWKVRLTIAAVKQGYAIEYVSKVVLAFERHEYPESTVLTIPLRSTRDGPPLQQDAQQQEQQQQQQQQTVVVPGPEQSNQSGTGVVLVTSNIEAADIFVDGLFVGSVPGNLKLTAGVHIIEVRKSGFEPFKRELRVLAGSEVSIRALLE